MGIKARGFLLNEVVHEGISFSKDRTQAVIAQVHEGGSIPLNGSVLSVPCLPVEEKSRVGG